MNARVLGAAFWPQVRPALAVKYGERLAASMVKDGILERHKMPGRLPAALTLRADFQRRQAAFSNDYESFFWPQRIPDAVYEHDERAARVLLWLAPDEDKITFDCEARKENQGALKVPDGLLERNGNLIFFEVENSRKTGPNFTKMVKNAIEICNAPQALQMKNYFREAMPLARFLYLVVPEGYDVDSFKRRAEKLLVGADVLRVMVVADTEAGFLKVEQLELGR